MTKIQANSRILLRYQLLLEDGTEVENNQDIEALDFTMGDGTLTDGMESVLFDHVAGDTLSVTLPPDACFGYPNPDNIHSMPLSDFPDDLLPEAGQVVAFDGPDDEEIVGTVVEVKSKEVRIDFSHPLAGRTLIFNAEVLQVTDSLDS
ncbi:MAG: FKBP-type peptidyl-prolyl cis-trans isomerase [Gammaproteobacteria bacterium]|nr:FKBP-type peptidyl-prolyl cis-trans isomerase [Gammaproteobacteria bacterium]